MTNTTLTGLAPLVSPATKVLILGSFPGVRSLQAQEYYGHPQNQFWKILQAIWPSSAHGICASSYEIRSNWLLERGLGVWDVYARCEREGSLDSAIRNAVPNDIAALHLPQLQAIAHNGGESFRHAKAVEKSLIQAGLAGHVTVHRLPSTSPANATWTFDQKLTAWQAVLNP
jgi:hypoxanthine-DNA glycosylase